ncbi:MAG: sugar kinase [Acidimicrobiaceae bacterium]|nr:sugar kinase [Acidimicrobiaceae bacterium]
MVFPTSAADERDLDGALVTQTRNPAVPRRAVSRRVSRTGETLQLIRSKRGATISEVADMMDVARSTAAERVERLLAHGFLRSVNGPTNGRGRPASTFEFNADAGRILTAHVGMTGMRIGITDLDANLIHDRMTDHDITGGPERLVSRLVDEFTSILDSYDTSGAPLFGISIGLPGRVELAGISDARHQWASFPMGEQLSQRFGAPCIVDQDVNTLALGEQVTRHDSQGILICVKVGSVIGCGIAINGQIVRGSNGLAGEIGHTHVIGRSDPCACGNQGCLNAVAGGSALVKQLAERGFDVHHVRDVAALANAGEPAATEAIRQAGRHIGQVLAGCVNLLNPGSISLWGYLLDAEEPLVAGIRESLIALATPAASSGLTIAGTGSGDSTGLRGGALMAAATVLDPQYIDQLLDANF